MLALRDEVRESIAGVREEMRGSMAALREELVRTEARLREHSQAVKVDTLDFRQFDNCLAATRDIGEVYHLAADMGGIGYITTSHAAIARNNTLTSARMLEAARLNARLVRLRKVYGPLGTHEGGKEKTPAAISCKVALAGSGDAIDIRGDGRQTRSFMYIGDCVEGIHRLMRSDYPHPLNLGAEEMVTIGREPSTTLPQGLPPTYRWIESQLRNSGRIPLSVPPAAVV